MSSNADVQALVELARRLDSLKVEEMKMIHDLFPGAISRLSLQEAQNTDFTMAKLFVMQRCFCNLDQLSSELSLTDATQDDLLLLSIYAELAAQLLKNTNTIFQLATDFMLPKALQFSAIQTIYMTVAPSYTKISSLLENSTIQALSDQIIENFLQPLLILVFTRRYNRVDRESMFNSSIILSMIVKVLKESILPQESENLIAKSFSRILARDDVVTGAYLECLNYLAFEASSDAFRLITPPLTQIIKLTRKIDDIDPLVIPEKLIIPLMVDESSQERIRDHLACRRLLSSLRLDFEKSFRNFNFQNLSIFFVVAQRVLGLIFESSTTSSKAEVSRPTLTKQYRPTQVETVDADEFEALKRSVVIYALTLGGKLLTSTMDVNEALVGHMLLLMRWLSGRGLFSVNPSASFFALMGQNDAHLLEGIFWFQKILIRCHAHLHAHSKTTSSSMDVANSQTLAFRTICAKVPQLPLFLSVMNPYSLFVAFLDFLNYDHTLIMEFLLSGETEWFLQFLLDFVKFCLADWDRTFIALYGLKRKTSTTQSKVPVQVSDADVDALLELLLEKQMQHMNLDPDTTECDESVQLSDGEDEESTLTSVAVNSILQAKSENQNTFDAVISCLVRLLFHLENASEHGLIGYNIEPLLNRLREVESLYEKSDPSSSSTSR